jgi:hypothetical protein
MTEKQDAEVLDYRGTNNQLNTSCILAPFVASVKRLFNFIWTVTPSPRV